jgi:cobalt-zinc-cadmium efflux system membrane fusion protein
MFTYLCKVARPLSCIIAVTLLHACGRSSHEHDHHHGVEAHEEHGPHGGTLLREGGLDLELGIHEAGGPPHFRAYLRNDGKPISPQAFSVSATLTRLGGIQDRISFSPKGDFQLSEQEVVEPHSFDVNVTVNFNGKNVAWSYPSYEGRTTIASEVAAQSGIATDKAQPQTIQRTIRMRGKITPNEHRIAHIIPRFAGIVKEGRKHIGDPVAKGEVLAIIESNQSLQPYEVKSQIAGSVINGHLIVGEFVPENQWVYIVADLSEVWADFFVPLEELGSVKVGQEVLVKGTAGNETFKGTVDYVAPYADEKAQAQLVRVVLPNDNMRLVPGMFVTGDLVVSRDNVSVAVRREGLQTFGKWTVVFAKYGDTYEFRPLTIGVSDAEWAEVSSGLSAGTEYVTRNSFTIKADILKHGASHDH